MEMSYENSTEILRIYSAFAALGVSGEEFETLVEIAEKGNEVAASRLTSIKREIAHLMPWVAPVGFSGLVEGSSQS
jgi:hypothetical protein